MTAPDSRDSVEMRLLNDLHLIASQGETPDGDGVTVNVQLWAEKWADRLQALARGPQQAGGEDHSPEEIASVVSDLRTLAKDGWIVADIAANLIEKLHPLQAEVARLTGANDALADALREANKGYVHELNRAETAEAVLREAGRDAERWRFLTSMDVGEYIGLVEYNNPDKLAHAIDAIRLVRDGDSGEG